MRTIIIRRFHPSPFKRKSIGYQLPSLHSSLLDQKKLDSNFVSIIRRRTHRKIYANMRGLKISFFSFLLCSSVFVSFSLSFFLSFFLSAFLSFFLFFFLCFFLSFLLTLFASFLFFFFLYILRSDHLPNIYSA